MIVNIKLHLVNVANRTAFDMKTMTEAITFYHDIKRYVASKINNSDDVEDIVQSIFLKIARSDGPSTPKKLRAWLWTIAHNMVMDHYRRQHRQSTMISNNNNLQEMSNYNLLTAENEVASCLAAFIKTLPRAEQAVLIWVYLQERRLKDYATYHQLNYSTVKSIIYRARRHLKTVLVDCCQLLFDRRQLPISCQSKVSNNCLDANCKNL